MPMRFLGGLSESQVTNILMSMIPPELQADAILNQAAPVQNTWYTVLDTTTNVRVLNILWVVETTSETLEIEVTIDGRVFSLAGAGIGIADTILYLQFSDSNFALEIDACPTNPLHRNINATGNPFFFEARSVKVRIRKTTANGVGNLHCGVHYQKW